MLAEPPFARRDTETPMPETAQRRRTIVSLQALASVVALAVLAGGCSNTTESPQSSVASVERNRLPDEPTPPTVPSDVAGAPPMPAPPAIDIPPNTLYVCVVDRGGVRKQTTIEFAPKVGELCARNPEMGPCQYERNVCRNTGGRVYAANGQEITLATESEYDKKVMRVRFKSN